jgi:hypothetical protein
MFIKKCEAETKDNTPCKQPGMLNGKCRFHGGLSSYEEEAAMLASDYKLIKDSMDQIAIGQWWERLDQHFEHLNAAKRRKASRLKRKSLRSNRDQN